MSDFSAGTPHVDLRRIDWMLRHEADMSFRRRVRTVFDWIPLHADSLVLDLPCGRGFYLNLLRQVSECRLLGFDLDRSVLQVALRQTGRLPRLLPGRVDAVALPLAANSVDAIILAELLEHVADDVAVLRECLRVLKPGGVMAITVPNADYPFAWDPVNKTLETLFGVHIGRGPLAGIWANHERLYTRQELRERVLAAGLQVEAERSLTHHALPFSHFLLYGLGKPLLESGLLPEALGSALDRSRPAREDGSRQHALCLALRLLEWCDRHNRPEEPPGRRTVNIALKASKPL